LTQPQAFGPPQIQKIDADPFAALAGLCAIAGIALSLIGRRLATAAAISGGAGAVSLFIMKSRLDDQLQKQAEGMASASYETGFTLAVLLLIGGAAWNAYVFLQSRRTNETGRLAPDTGQSGKENAPVGDGSPPLPLEKQRSPIAAHSSEIYTAGATGNRHAGPQICRRCSQPISATVGFCESCGEVAEATAVSTESNIPSN
jgi:hypothetical protein